MIINLHLSPNTPIIRLLTTALTDSNLKVSDPLAKPLEAHLLNTVLCRLVHIAHGPFILDRELYRRLVELPYRLHTRLAQVTVRVKGLLGGSEEASVLQEVHDLAFHEQR